MEQLLKKLNFKDQQEVLVLNCPEDHKDLLKSFGSGTLVYTQIPSQPVSFALIFVTKQEQIDALTPKIAAQMPGDCILWFAYPKGTSKKYKCDFNRDTGWQIVGQHGFEPVRMVAIDGDWSALRFRRADFIKKLTRSEEMSISEEGKKRTRK